MIAKLAKLLAKYIWTLLNTMIYMNKLNKHLVYGDIMTLTIKDYKITKVVQPNHQQDDVRYSISRVI